MREEEIKRIRENLHLRERIVIKVGSSSITHAQTGALNFRKLEVLVREICDLKNQGKDMILVSSGAIAVGRRTVDHKLRDRVLPVGFPRQRRRVVRPCLYWRGHKLR
jgi:hypothetical protein